jgi:hypothetical protein
VNLVQLHGVSDTRVAPAGGASPATVTRIDARMGGAGDGFYRSDLPPGPDPAVDVSAGVVPTATLVVPPTVAGSGLEGWLPVDASLAGIAGPVSPWVQGWSWVDALGYETWFILHALVRDGDGHIWPNGLQDGETFMGLVWAFYLNHP